MFLGTVDDITERLALEQAQFEAAELFRTAFDDAPTGILLTDVSTTVPTLIRSNQAYADMLGHTTEELAGIHLADLTHPDDVREALKARTKLMAGGARPPPHGTALPPHRRPLDLGVAHQIVVHDQHQQLPECPGSRRPWTSPPRSEHATMPSDSPPPTH